MFGTLLASPMLAHSETVQFTFAGTIEDGTFYKPGCPGLCDGFGFSVPPAGNPIAIVVAYDTSAIGNPEGSAPYPGTVTRYDLSTPAFVDFGYGQQFRFSDYSVRVVNDQVGNSAPDRVSFFRSEPVGNPGAWFNFDIESASTSFLSGASLPSSLDAGLVNTTRGRLYFSTNGVTSEYSQFVLTSVQVAAVPEAPTYALMLAGLGVVGWLARKRAASTGG